MRYRGTCVYALEEGRQGFGKRIKEKWVDISEKMFLDREGREKENQERLRCIDTEKREEMAKRRNFQERSGFMKQK
jgi:hypothetical protein